MHKKFRIRFGFSCSDNRKSKIKNLKWLGLSVIAFVLVETGAVAQAQQPKKVPRIGFLDSSTPSSSSARIEAFRRGLREVGYVEGQNILIEYRFADGKLDRLTDLATDLVRVKVDVIMTGGGPPTRAAKNAAKLIPIVMTNISDPVAIGFVASLARPGGNITGLSSMQNELGGKRLELLKEIVPQISRVAVLVNRHVPGYAVQMKEIEVAGQALGLRLQPLEVRGPNDLEGTFSAITRGRAGAFIGLTDTRFGGNRDRIAELSAKNRLPAVYQDRLFVEAGGLMSYGTNRAEWRRRVASYVDRILKGAKPADLPVERPTKFEFVINLKAAKQIGLTIPPNVLARADKVIR